MEDKKMSSRIGSHQLRNGLFVSGRPEQQKERPTAISRAVPYTGGDVKKSGELGKMYGIDMSTGDHHTGPPILKKPSSRASSSSQHNSGSVRSGPNSGQMGGHKSSNSGPIPKKSSSGSGPIQPTGLIYSGPLSSSAGRRSGQLEPTISFKKIVYGSSVTSLSGDIKMGFNVSRVAMWVLFVVILMALMAGAFVMATVKKIVILVAVGAAVAPILMILLWNYAYKERGLVEFLRRYPDAELRGAVNGQFVKVTGVVTCGSIPLETSFQRVPRCVYASTELHEYKACVGNCANPRQRSFSWGRRHSENYVGDFYISDFQTGLRALVKAGYGAKVAPFVKSKTVVDVTSDSELSPNFIRWLADRNLSSDDRVMRLKEGYIKEGSTVSVMGVVMLQENVLMIVPPPEPISIGCQWLRCLLPTYVEGLILTCDDIQDGDVIPV
ncbi:uncharacterized membrane protein At1g16860 [Solanum tuberosum]|nr:PREDICTED: uncharacterized membrane protein At1g16860 [Solanum tuberosum]